MDSRFYNTDNAFDQEGSHCNWYEIWATEDAAAKVVVRQTAAEIAERTTRADEALAALAEAEDGAGTTARNAIAKSRRLAQAYTETRDRKAYAMRLLGQRKGLLRILRAQTGIPDGHAIDKQATTALTLILELSANAAVLTGTGWDIVARWFGFNAEATLAAFGTDRARTIFEEACARSERILARRLPVRLEDYRTAPTPQEIAERVGITTELLRRAGANQCGLTSIDRLSRREQVLERVTRHRREKGVRARADQTQRAQDVAYAQAAGVSDRTIRNWRKDGILEAQFTARGVRFPKV